jgi:hypothetical protein
MRCSKKHLVAMLIQCNNLLKLQNPTYYMVSNPNYNGLSKCDVCECHPLTIIKTEKGTFCKECYEGYNRDYGKLIKC